jgi:hypothetical protein
LPAAGGRQKRNGTKQRTTRKRRKGELTVWTRLSYLKEGDSLAVDVLHLTRMAFCNAAIQKGV